jgi:ATP synthase protein I
VTSPPTSSTWDISFLRVGALATAAVTAVAAPVAGLIDGRSSAVGVLAGAAVVTAFFCLSGVVIAWAGRIDDALTLPAALGTFLVKALVLFAVLNAVPADGWIDRLTLAWTVIAGALLWSVVQARWVWTRQLYYVQPPAPPREPSQVSPHVPLPDPEKPPSPG